MEPINKSHLCTEGIVPYSEVVPYWEVFQNNDVISLLKIREFISGALFQIQHLAVGMHTIYTNSKEPCLTNAHRTTLPGHQHYKLPRLPLDELHNTVTIGKEVLTA